MMAQDSNRHADVAAGNRSRYSGRFFQGGRPRQILIYIRSSFWFFPAVIIIAAIGLALGLVELDRYAIDTLRDWNPRWFDNDPEGARGMLQAIAGSMATVAGVVFSITIVALTLASNQYTSRVLRNFMRDAVTQSMLGIFIGVYLYCLLVLRAISAGNGAFVPSLALLAAVILAVLASATFIFFIHHIASSIQASELAKAITCETFPVLDEEFPAGSPATTGDVPLPDQCLTWHPVPARDVGYIQTIDIQALTDFACAHDLIVRMERRVGDFVAPGWALVSIAGPAEADVDMADAINRIYAVDSYRTIDQDAAFGIRQLVDIALKALSPGINDTTTAVICIEHLSALLTHCAPRPARAPHLFCNGVLRVIKQPHDFSYLLSLAFDQIVESAKGNTEILLRMMAAIERIGYATRDDRRINALQTQLDDIAEVIAMSEKTSNAQRRLQAKLAAVREALDARNNAGNSRRHLC